MKLFIHYQEQAVICAYAHDRHSKLLTDVVISSEELEEMYDEHQIEHLLNSVGTFDDNGVVYLDANLEVMSDMEGWKDDNEYPLEFRIKRVISGANLDDYLERNRVELSGWNGVHPIGET